MNIPRSVRFGMLIVAIIDLLIFANANPMTILAVGVGTVVLLMGMAYNYRPAAVLGMLITVIGATSAIQVATLLEVGSMMTAILGLLIPTSILIWLALSSDEGEDLDVHPASRSMWINAAFMLGCLLSAPVVVVIVSLLAPGVSMRMTAVSEIAILLVTAAILGTAITLRADKAPKTLVVPEEPEKSA